MPAGSVPVSSNSSCSSVTPRRGIVAWTLYHLGLVAGGLFWVGLASTLCGCGAMNGYVMNESGRGYYQKANYTAARHDFERALMDAPYNANYAYNVARSMERQGDLAAAEQMYQHALRLDPSHQPAYHGFSEMLVTQGRQGEAYNLVQAWNQTQPYNPASHVAMARVERQMGDFASAQTHLQTALQMNPQSPRILDEMGQFQQQTGNSGMAAAFYQKSLASNPYQPEVSSRLNAMASGQQPDPALQLASFMTQSDATLGTTAGSPLPGRTMSGPMMVGPAIPGSAASSQPVSGPQTVETFHAPVQNGQTLLAPGAYSSQPLPAPTTDAAGRPVQLGAPVPLTQVTPGAWHTAPAPSAGGQVMIPQQLPVQTGAQVPMISGAVPVMQAF